MSLTSIHQEGKEKEKQTKVDSTLFHQERISNKKQKLENRVKIVKEVFFDFGETQLEEGEKKKKKKRASFRQEGFFALNNKPVFLLVGFKKLKKSC